MLAFLYILGYLLMVEYLLFLGLLFLGKNFSGWEL